MNIAVIGANGKMGSMVVDLLLKERNKYNVEKIDINDDYKNLKNISLAIDFSVFDASKKIIPELLKQKINCIVGTSGWQTVPVALENVKGLSAKYNTSVLIVPNFSIGAVLEKEFAKVAAKYYNSAEIIEMHHNKKIDAPSGTSIDLAKSISSIIKTKEVDDTQKEISGARGAVMDGIHIHSIRQPGLLAHQEIAFGGAGERLTIKHDSFSRESFVKGIKLAINNIGKRKGLTIGLENLLN